MFTGLVERLATVARLARAGPGVRLIVRDEVLAARAAIGDSIAVNGCCLTVVAMGDGELSFDAGEETLSRTNLSKLQPGDRVNLEGSLRLGDAVGGHLVTGHIDAVGTIASRHDDAEWCTMRFNAPRDLMRLLASKGSVAIDGVSLTVVDVDELQFSAALIPHTLAATTLGLRQVGDDVNLEVDLLARYVARQLAWHG